MKRPRYLDARKFRVLPHSPRRILVNYWLAAVLIAAWILWLIISMST